MNLFTNLNQSIAANNIGDWASIIGLLTAVIGFGVTIFGVFRSKRAAEQARNAVSDVRKDLLHTNTVADFAASVAIMEEIKRLHRQQAWSIMPDRYAEVRKSLITIRTANSDLSILQRSKIQGAIQHFKGIEGLIEEELRTEGNSFEVAKLNKIVSDQIDNIQEILTELKTKIGD